MLGIYLGQEMCIRDRVWKAALAALAAAPTAVSAEVALRIFSAIFSVLSAEAAVLAASAVLAEAAEDDVVQAGALI